MSADHLNVNEVSRFLRNATEPGSSSRGIRLVRHLLEDCTPCQESLKSAVSQQSGAYEYGASFAAAERSLAAFFARETPGDAPPEQLLEELSRLPVEEQAATVKAQSRFTFPPFVRHLVDASHEIGRAHV